MRKRTIKIVPARQGSQPHINVVAPNGKVVLTTETFKNNSVARRTAKGLEGYLRNSVIKDLTK